MSIWTTKKQEDQSLHHLSWLKRSQRCFHARRNRSFENLMTHMGTNIPYLRCINRICMHCLLSRCIPISSLFLLSWYNMIILYVLKNNIKPFGLWESHFSLRLWRDSSTDSTDSTDTWWKSRWVKFPLRGIVASVPCFTNMAIVTYISDIGTRSMNHRNRNGSAEKNMQQKTSGVVFFHQLEWFLSFDFLFSVIPVSIVQLTLKPGCPSF